MSTAKADKLIADLTKVFGPPFDEYPFRSFVAALPPEATATTPVIGPVPLDLTGLSNIYNINDTANDAAWQLKLDTAAANTLKTAACGPKGCYDVCKGEDVLLRKLCKLITDDNVKKLKAMGCKGASCRVPSFAKTCGKRKAACSVPVKTVKMVVRRVGGTACSSLSGTRR